MQSAGASKPSANSSPSYAEANSRFYERFWAENPLYSSPYPNAEEGVRAAIILEFIARAVEAEGTRDRKLRILDVGCGRGWLTHWLYIFGDAEGCEPAGGSIQLARKLFPDLRFRQGFLSELLVQPAFQPVDIIVSSEVIEHVPRELKTEFVQDLACAVRSRGHCVVTTPRAELWKQCGESPSQLVEDWLTERELRSLFSNEQWVMVDHKRALPTHSTLLDRVFRRLHRHPPEWLARLLDYRSSLYQIWYFRRR